MPWQEVAIPCYAATTWEEKELGTVLDLLYIYVYI